MREESGIRSEFWLGKLCEHHANQWKVDQGQCENVLGRMNSSEAC